jgi:molybdopterin converting factor small subunit
MTLLEDILGFFKKIFIIIQNNILIAKLNMKIIKINKKKNLALRNLGIIVYEFYNIDKNFVDDDEVKDLIMEIKDYEIEIDEIERQIEQIKNPIDEKDEIDNELLLNINEEQKDKNNEQQNQ